LTFDEYQIAAAKTAIYPGKGEILGLLYCGLGAASEGGEVAGKIKKVLRDNNGVVDAVFQRKIADEIGGALWYLAQAATEIGVDLGAIAQDNIAILASRQARGTLHGDGDNR